jgi:hypothetical protein
MDSNLTAQSLRPDLALWQALALEDEALEQADLVVLNLTVARGIKSLEGLEIEKYVDVVDQWTAMFSRWLQGAEANFQKTPEKWKDDIRFFRVAMLAGFLGHVIGIEYIEDQKHSTKVSYTNPSDLFLNGVLDTKRGTCGNMATLHVAICRRMGWPVSLACVKSHYISRFDDGEVIHNIEASKIDKGGIASDTDEFYIEKFKLPAKAVKCGSDLRKLTAREMIATFLVSRGRHHNDSKQSDLADVDFALARHLFPNSRKAYLSAMLPMINRSYRLFVPHEIGHPNSLYAVFDELDPDPEMQKPRYTPPPVISSEVRPIPRMDVFSPAYPPNWLKPL